MVDFPAETDAGVPAGLEEMEPGPFLPWFCRRSTRTWCPVMTG
jgi:hypothetical protein